MAEPKIYVGNGKLKTTQYGDLISVSLDLDTLIEQYNNHGYQSNQNKRMLRITIGQRREVGQYGDTHTVTLDTWHPDSFNSPKPIQIIEGVKQQNNDTYENEDLPF